LPTKAKLLGSTLTPEEADQLKKEKKELKEREKKEKEEKKERKRKEKEEKRLEGKDPRGVLTLRRKGLDKRTPQNPGLCLLPGFPSLPRSPPSHHDEQSLGYPLRSFIKRIPRAPFHALSSDWSSSWKAMKCTKLRASSVNLDATLQLMPCARSSIWQVPAFSFYQHCLALGQLPLRVRVLPVRPG